MLFVAMIFAPVLGLGIVALNTGLFPRFFSAGVRIFFWPPILEIGAFLLEAVFIVLYRYTWDRLRDRRGLHMSLGSSGRWARGWAWP